VARRFSDAREVHDVAIRMWLQAAWQSRREEEDQNYFLRVAITKLPETAISTDSFGGSHGDLLIFSNAEGCTLGDSLIPHHQHIFRTPFSADYIT
jgi:hypothetical protein